MIVTWNQDDKGSEISLSNNNLTAKRNTTNISFHSVRAT